MVSLIPSFSAVQAALARPAEDDLEEHPAKSMHAQSSKAPAVDLVNFIKITPWSDRLIKQTSCFLAFTRIKKEAINSVYQPVRQIPSPFFFANLSDLRDPL